MILSQQCFDLKSQKNIATKRFAYPQKRKAIGSFYTPAPHKPMPKPRRGARGLISQMGAAARRCRWVHKKRGTGLNWGEIGFSEPFVSPCHGKGVLLHTIFQVIQQANYILKL